AADRHPVAVAAAVELGYAAVALQRQRLPHLLERVRGDEQADRLLLDGQQLGLLELLGGDRRVLRLGERGRRVEVEDRALPDLRVELGLLTRALRLLEHDEHAAPARAGRAERPALDQRLDRLLVDLLAVDARAEV